MTRVALAGLVGIMLGTLLGAALGIHSQEAYTADDTLAAIDQYSEEMGVSRAWLYRIVRCETGWTFDPYSVGRHGELGAAQLAPWGELRRFYAWGYDQPFSPYQSVRFLAQRLSMGGARAWSCA
jgi:soluble lytic murein transglycosylase-like protein